jgi:ferredoxin
MIITKKRDIEAILSNIQNYKNIFLIGCSECATLCSTGGTEQLAEMKELLILRGKTVTGTFVAKTGCQVLGTKVELRKHTEEIEQADCILAMACGAGTQTAVELFEDKPVYTVNDTLFLGNMTRLQQFQERCSQCGECILDKTGGICPVTACPKGILVGPCGGCKDGKCEVSPDIPCAWVKIYERMKKIDQLQEFCDTTLPPKDWSKNAKPRTRITKDLKKIS